MAHSVSPTFPATSDLAFTDEIVATLAPLMPIVDEVLALLDRVPMERRLHQCLDGSWSSVEIITSDPNDPMQGHGTEWLDDLPSLLPLFEAFGGVIAHCTIARLAPDDLLDWHYDPVSLDHDLSRLHLPVRSNPDAVTDFCDARVHWPEGRLFYGDYGFPHRVLNTGGTERIHLYFDVPSADLRPLLPENLSGRHQIREMAVNRLLAWKSASRATSAA
jgi:hypothetical protein